jgi:hypothetical protein
MEKPGRPDDFEAALTDVLKSQSQHDEIDVARIDAFARSVPGRRLARRGAGQALGLVAAIAVVASVGLVFAAGPPSRYGATSTDRLPSAAASSSSAPSAAPSRSGVAASPGLPGPKVWGTDPGVTVCGQGATSEVTVLTAYSLGHASDYRSRVPSLGFQLDLERLDPVLVVVFKGTSPVESNTQMLVASVTHEPNPGTYDICMAGPDWHRRYLNVVINWSYLAGTTTPPPGSTSGVVARLPDQFGVSGTNLVWDQKQGVLWFAKVGCAGEASAVYRWDPKTAKTENWTIPGSKSTCERVKARLDDSGALWVMESSLLVRFDVTTHAVGSVRISPDGPGANSFAVAIVADGSSVLLVRANTATLTRVDAAMRISTTAIPADLAGAAGDTDLAVGDGVIFYLRDGQLFVLNSNGTLKQRSDLAGRTLMVRPDGSVVLVQDAGRAIVVTPAGSAGEAVVLPSEAGTAGGVVPLPSEAGTAGGVVPLPSEAGTDLATDWNGHTWYVAMDGQGPVLIEVSRPT